MQGGSKENLERTICSGSRRARKWISLSRDRFGALEAREVSTVHLEWDSLLVAFHTVRLSNVRLRLSSVRLEQVRAVVLKSARGELVL